MSVTWVLLRGLSRDSRHWGGFPEILGSQFPGATVVALDLPGNGRLHRTVSPWSVEEMSEHCRVQLLHLGMRPPYYVLALSLGAMAAISWATRRPDELAGCVLINTSLRHINPFYRRLRARNYATLARLAFHGFDTAACERTILALTSRRFASSREVLDQWIAHARESPISRANVLRQLVAAARFRAPRLKPLPPLLLLASARDALVDVRCSREIAARWRCDLAEHPDAGHDLPLDDGLWVAEQARRFVGRAGSFALPATA